MSQRVERHLTEEYAKKKKKKMQRKGAQHPILSGNPKLKKQWDSITHLLDGLKSEMLTSPNAIEHVEKQELSFTAGGNAKWEDWFF